MPIEDEIREICDHVAQAMMRAYQRGEDDAIERMFRAVKAHAENHEAATSPIAAPVIRPKPTQPRKRRAPKGAVSALVLRVMSATEGPTVAEIKDGAADDVERAIAPSSIRAHLRTGRDEGRYVERHGRWYRANSAHESSEAADPAGGQAASFFPDQEGR